MLTGKQHVFQHTVRTSEVDVAGVVYHAKYLEYMDWARGEWLFESGCSAEEMIAQQMVAVLANITITYRRSLKMRDPIKIVTTPVKAGTKSFVVHQEIILADDVCACEADITMVMVDLKEQRSVPLPTKLKSLFLDNT